MISKVNKKTINFILIIISGLGVVWLSFQDDSIFIFFHPISILSIIIFTLEVVYSINRVLMLGFKAMKYELFLLGLFALILLGFRIKENEIFKSNKVFESILIDDLSNINLVLRQDGSFETTVNTIYGSDLIDGKYELIRDTIFFHDRPYSNDFISQKILIDKERQIVWIKKMKNGEFDTTQYFAGYFEIRYENLE